MVRRGTTKRGQYKIQQMAFMILAIFFFFVLVGLFFVGWQYANIMANFAKLQEEKALSALKVIADSTELNCEQSEDWCIDRDKLMAFSEYSHLYNNYWGVASIELLIVYPTTGQRVVGFNYEPPSSGGSGGSTDVCSTIDHNGNGNPDNLVPSCGTVSESNVLDSKRVTVGAKKKPPYHGGTNQKIFGVEPGQVIEFSNFKGQIGFDPGPSTAACGSGAPIYAGFYGPSGGKKSEFKISKFKGGGKKVPSGANKLLVYAKEQNKYSSMYGDNTGTCYFTAKKIEKTSSESCGDNTKQYRLSANQGRLDHQASNNEGNARKPLKIYDNLVPGEIIKFEGVSGQIDYNTGGSGAVASCRKGRRSDTYGGAVAAFYTSDGRYIRDHPLVEFEDGIEVPPNSAILYAYVIESNKYKFNYLDNAGGCDFSSQKLVVEECPEVEDVTDDVSTIDDFGDSSGEFGIDDEYVGEDAILCPAENCDYYILYDNGQSNKRTYSAYVNVCEDIDRSHQICELGKLMLGVKIKDD